MLYIEVKSNFGTNENFEWHLSDPVPTNLPQVVKLQADGDELMLILKAMEATRNKEFLAEFYRLRGE